MTTRQELADALSTVDDINGFAYRPTVVNPGDAWPLLTGYDRNGEQLPALTFYTVWRVMVALPTDEQAADAFLDGHAVALVEALLPCGYVDSIEPALLATAGSNVGPFAMLITMRGE